MFLGIFVIFGWLFVGVFVSEVVFVIFNSIVVFGLEILIGLVVGFEFFDFFLGNIFVFMLGL